MLTRLHERTLYLVHNRSRKLTYDMIAKEIGENPNWIKKFSCGQISDPGVNKVEKLYVFLSGKELDV